MLSKELEFSLNMAFRDAREKRYEFMTVEHLLLALLDNPNAKQALVSCSANIERLRKDLSNFIEETTPLIPEDDDKETQPTLGFQRVLQRSIFQAQSSEQKEVNGANVLVAIFNEQESQAVYLLTQQNIARLDIVTYLSHGDDSSESSNRPEDDNSQQVESNNNQDQLEQFTTNLNERALQGKIDPLIGRNEEITRTIQILCRRRKNFNSVSS